MEPLENKPRVDLVGNPELLQQARERSLACLSRYDNEVLLALVRLTDIATRVKLLIPEVTAIEPALGMERDLTKEGLFNVFRRRLTRRPHTPAPEVMATSPATESDSPSWKIVLGEVFDKEEHGKIVSVACIYPWEDRPYNEFMGNPAPGISWPGFQVHYKLEHKTGSSCIKDSTVFSPDPVMYGTIFGDVRLRRGAHTFLSDESNSAREVFVDNLVSKVRVLVQAARNPELNPGFAMEFARHNLEFEE